jgi:cytochrome b pre-mRNA-processing protein 3
LSFLARIFDSKKKRERLLPLYARIIVTAREPLWYREGEVPDTVDGRFDMIVALLTLVLLRLEREDAREDSVLLTEAFVADMDGSIRQMGIGDLLVGKHIGRMMSALGGRLTAFRAAADHSLEGPVIRNVFHDAPPSGQTVDFVAARLERIRAELAALSLEQLIAGAFPRP